jgi:Zn-finger nucleic acid-binding protein
MEKLSANSLCPCCGGKMIVVTEDDLEIQLGCPVCEEVFCEFKQ